MWTLFDRLSDAALQGLIAHELTHWYRWLVGVPWPVGEPGEEHRLEEQRTNRLMIRWGFEHERDELWNDETQIPQSCWD